MLALIGRKWWITLLQGIILIVLSIYLFNHPVAVLAGISFWFGWLVVLTGIIGVSSWIGADKADRESISLFWNMLTIVFGIILLSNMAITMKTITILFGLWMIITGVQLFQLGWPVKKHNSLAWVLVIAGIFSVIAGFMMIFDLGLAAVGISTLLGLQVLFTGIALIIFSIAKKSVSSRLKSMAEDLKSAN